ncbi:hypothetical protein [Staphylothermus hellenicus]|uniref:Uncharacterized protein n=1 Tax=Staphylothermus hellenicus (strain DSM 12710 / JCM 10830 / BK20S6-10-b1 / P8) TaxID=591019 RepID=D7DCA3_STAHD|nr:hypothetical protein [Staphylothermus hellenicus]ADI31800.1 hypothetical protein Shell_0677 [Staphylothermus hellenicus DSM 12710]
MKKYQRIIENKNTRLIAFYSRLINFLEDILEDAECDNVYVSLPKNSFSTTVFVEGSNCRYDLLDSINVFAGKYDLQADIGRGNIGLASLYYKVIDEYKRSLHYMMKELAVKSLVNHIEFYLGILFNGKAFLVEGEEDRVVLPSIPQCFSSHTHPSRIPIPSRADLKTIIRLFLDRGLAHAIETVGSTLVIYRTGPLTIDDLDIVRDVEKSNNIIEALKLLSSTDNIKTLYL